MLISILDSLLFLVLLLKQFFCNKTAFAYVFWDRENLLCTTDKFVNVYFNNSHWPSGKWGTEPKPMKQAAIKDYPIKDNRTILTNEQSANCVSSPVLRSKSKNVILICIIQHKLALKSSILVLPGFPTVRGLQLNCFKPVFSCLYSGMIIQILQCILKTQTYKSYRFLLLNKILAPEVKQTCLTDLHTPDHKRNASRHLHVLSIESLRQVHF